MSHSEPIVPKESGEFGSSKTETLVEIFVAYPLMFTLLFLFLVILAIPMKILSLQTKVFR